MTPQIMGGLIRARRMVLEIDAQDELTKLKLQNIATAIEQEEEIELTVRDVLRGQYMLRADVGVEG